MGIRRLVTPRDSVLIEEMARLAVTSAQCLDDLGTLFESYGALAERRQAIKELEQKADHLARIALDRIDRAPNLPFDADDMAALTRAYAGICKGTLASVNALFMYGVKKASPEMGTFATLAMAQGKALGLASQAVQTKKTLPEAAKHCTEVSRLEREGDRLLIHTMAALLKGNDAVHILKLKEVYESLEEVTDRCEDAAEALAAMARRATRR